MKHTAWYCTQAPRPLSAGRRARRRPSNSPELRRSVNRSSVAARSSPSASASSISGALDPRRGRPVPIGAAILLPLQPCHAEAGASRIGARRSRLSNSVPRRIATHIGIGSMSSEPGTLASPRSSMPDGAPGATCIGSAIGVAGLLTSESPGIPNWCSPGPLSACIASTPASTVGKRTRGSPADRGSTRLVGCDRRSR